MTTRERILKYILSCPHSPSVSEIAREVKRAKSTVHVHLLTLEREGDIQRVGDERRIFPSERDAA